MLLSICIIFIVHQCSLSLDVYLDNLSKLHGGINKLAKTLQPSEYWPSLQLLLKIDHHYNSETTIIAWGFPRRCSQLFEHCRKCLSWFGLRTTIVGIVLIFINCNRYKINLYWICLIIDHWKTHKIHPCPCEAAFRSLLQFPSPARPLPSTLCTWESIKVNIKKWLMEQDGM